MKKILFALLIFWSVQVNSQATFRIKDSTFRYMSGVLTSKVPAVVTPVYVQSLSRIDSSGKLKMLVVDTTRAAVGLRSVYWINIPTGGGGGGGTPGGSNKQIQYNNSGSFGGSGNLTQETNQVLVTATDAATAPFVVKGASAHSANFFEIQNNSGTNQVFVNSGGQIRSVQNIVAFNGATEQVTIGYSGLGGVAGIDIGASSDAAIYRSAANQLTAHVQQWRWTGRAQTNQGADVASAAGAIALGTDGNSFEITGTAAITLISNVSWQNGSEVTLLFTSTATLTDGTANSGTDIGMELSGNTNFTASAGSTLTLILSEIGGTQRWREVSRSVN